MNIAIIYEGLIPVKTYGGTGRDIWYLGNELHKLGHKVTYIVAEGSSCPFGDIIILDKNSDINNQIPEYIDIVNIHYPPKNEIKKPHVVTIHGNSNDPNLEFPINSFFVSHNHAQRFGSEAFVYNGMDWSNYPKPNFNSARKGFHFLGNAAWKVKNLKAAMSIAKKNDTTLEVLGGKRFNFKMGMRFTLDSHIHFHGMVGDNIKGSVMNHSHGLLFPVLWNEPMGLAIIESLYYGCPVFATPYGALPELVSKEFGMLSNSLPELAKAASHANSFNKKLCHEYARDTFNSKIMAEKYLHYFEEVLNGKTLNKNKPQLIKKQDEKYLDFKWE